MRSLALSVVALCALGGLVAPATADDQAMCLNGGVSDADIAACTRLIAAGRDLNRAYARRCFLYARRGRGDDVERGLADCNELLRREPNNPYVLSLRAGQYVRKGELDRALADLNQAYRLMPQNSGVRTVFGQYYVAKGDYDRAISELDEAIRIAPDNAFAYRHRGIAYERKGEFDKALADFRVALQRDPNRMENVGRESAEGIERIERRQSASRQPPASTPAPAPAPASPPAADDQRMCHNGGVSDADIAACSRLIASNTLSSNDLVRAFVRRCFLYARRGGNDLERAVADCNDALRRQPNNWAALALRAAYYVRTGNLDRALADLNEGNRLAPQGSTTMRSVFAQYYLAKGDYDRAISEASEAIRMSPDNAYPYRHRGLAYEKKGEFDKALADLRVALQRDPARLELLGRESAEGIERIEKRLASRQPAPEPQVTARPAPAPGPTLAPAPAPAPSDRQAAEPGKRVALVIGNAEYPEADPPLTQPTRQAHAFADDLRRSGYEVEVGENLSKQRMQSALDSFMAKITPSSVALLFFSGYGIQADKQTYLIPVDAQVWTERDAVRDGFKLETILRDMNDKGAAGKLVVVDASRRNPYERRFRGLSVGLAPVTAPAGSLVIYSASPGQVASDESGVFVTELSKEIRNPNVTAEEAFIRTRVGVSNRTRNQQIPWVSSSLTSELKFTRSGR